MNREEPVDFASLRRQRTISSLVTSLTSELTQATSKRQRHEKTRILDTLSGYILLEDQPGETKNGEYLVKNR